MDLITDPATAFERVYVVNLDRRPDRWKRFSDGFPADWPFPPPMRVPAVDGRLVRHPDYWTSGGGAWGCYRSHLRLIEQCLNEGVRSVLLLEDDALFPPDFTALVTAWLRHVPTDWQMLYLGGQHLFAKAHPPLQVGEQLWQPYNVNRTHAFALQGDMLKIVYHHLLRTDWHRRNHIDHHLGRLHQRRQHRIYCPPRWLVGQAGGKSNISGRVAPDRVWKSASSISQETQLAPLVVVVGLHSSGSSALAGVLWHLGVWLGERLGGFYGNTPGRECGYEERGLVGLCEWAYPFPRVGTTRRADKLAKRLNCWQTRIRTEAGQRNAQWAGGKYPQLTAFLPLLRTLVAPKDLRVIISDRAREASIASLQKRTADRRDPAAIAAHQTWLGEQLDKHSGPAALTVRYDDLIAQPAAVVARIVDFLGLTPTADQVAAAVASIDPAKRHI